MQWKAFRNKLKMESIPADMQIITSMLKGFLMPIMEASHKGETYTKTWRPESAWQVKE
jgi:hypothetical protein